MRKRSEIRDQRSVGSVRSAGSLPIANATGISVQPLADAVAQLGAKTPIAVALNSQQWSAVPAQLRLRAQFSATLEDARVLQTIQDKLNQAIGLQREKVANGEAFVDRSSFIGDMRQVMAEAGLGTGEGGVTDLQSAKRLGLIYDMQTRQAQEFARHKFDMAPDVLNEWPAQELVRLEERIQPRDWLSRWEQNGGPRLVDGTRMIALKTNPIWVNISAFGTPWPPFDYDSGMGLVDIDRAEAELLGLIAPETNLEPLDEDFNTGVAASVADLAPDLIQFLEQTFGDKISIADGLIKWVTQEGVIT